MQESSDRAFDRALTLFSSMNKAPAPAPQPTQQSADFSFGMQLGQKIAGLEAVQKQASGFDWAAFLVGMSPVAEKLVGVLDKYAEAKIVSRETDLARAVASSPDGKATLTLVQDAPAPPTSVVVAVEPAAENGAAE
jgi:hypothetical protein